MRPKVVAAIVLLAFALWGTAVFLSRPVRHEPGGEVPVNLPAARAATNISPEKAYSAPVALAVSNGQPAVTAAPVIQATNHAVYVQERTAELMTLAMNDDSDSLNTIWSELSNSDKEIRAGALAAVVQFGDRSVAPHLRQLAAQTEDPAEKAGIIAAADYLELPPLTELQRAQPANGPPSPAQR